MAVCLVAHPRYDPFADSWWVGKLRCWFVADEVFAKRNSKNCPKGTIDFKEKTMDKNYTSST